MTYDREERKREKSKINNKKGGLFIKKRKEKRERGGGGVRVEEEVKLKVREDGWFVERREGYVCDGNGRCSERELKKRHTNE